MGSPIGALLAQAAPASDQGMSDERIKQLLAQVQQNQQTDPSLAGYAPPAPAATPAPSPAPAAPANPGVMGAIGNFLMSLLPSTKSLAKPAPAATPQPLTPEELAARQQRYAR